MATIVINSGGTITAQPGDTYIVSSSVSSNITFNSGGTPVSFNVEFQASNSNNFDVKFNANTNPNITLADGVNISDVKIDAANASSINLTAGNNVTIEEFDGSNGADVITIGDGFATTSDFDMRNGNDVVQIGANANFSNKNIEMKGGDNNLTIGPGLSAKDITADNGANTISVGSGATFNNLDIGSGTNIVTLGDDVTAHDFKTGNGSNTFTIGNDLSMNNFDTGDGNDTIVIGTGATINDLKTTKGTDSITIDAGFDIGKLEAGDGNDFVYLGAGGTINTLSGGKGVDVLVSRGSYGSTEFEVVICFASGTLIQTVDGERPVEGLVPGDLVLTLDHGPQPVRWISKTSAEGKGRFAPIVFSPDVLGNHTELMVSPQHRVLLNGWAVELVSGLREGLVAAKHLINGGSVRQVEMDKVTYVHLMFDRHEIVFSMGAPTESFYPGEVGAGSLDDEAREEIFALFPDLKKELESNAYLARPILTKHEASLAAQASSPECERRVF